MDKQLIYISGPISHRDLTERRKAFADTAEMLRGHGFDIVNPMENGLPENAPTRQHMRRDIEMLMRCDIIYMMKGWTHSKGCKVEFDVATSIGLPVMFQETGLETFKFE